jgi:DNA replication and repair protein RecF
MRLESLELYDFRNFGRGRIHFKPRLNFILGENGQGKTNLLEAVYLLCRGTSFRSVDSQNLLRRDSPSQSVDRAKICGKFRHENLDYSVDLLIEKGRKSATINSKKVGSDTLIRNFPIVLFSPESLSVIKDGPEQRRNLIDEVLVSHDPRQAKLLREFAKALKTRNRILKNIFEGIGERQGQIDSLESLNKIYFILATHLATARLKALSDIKPYLREAMTSILGEPDAEISVDYLISSESAMNWDETKVFDALRNRFLTLHSNEIASGTSLVGPHKHDIKLLLDGNDSRFYCSQGQQRALILALKIAQIVYHHRVHQTYPVLLLDDVMSELDAKKRVNLMKFLESVSAQILISATDLTWSEQFGLDRNSIFSVTQGSVGQLPMSMNV